MGRTLPSITISLKEEEEAYSRFRRALRRSDQLALDELFVAARQHLAAAAYAANPLPMETFFIAMLLEVHKKNIHQDVMIGELKLRIMELERRIEDLES
jgi:hypothetical protein